MSNSDKARVFNGFTTSVVFPDHAVDYAPEGCFFYKKQVNRARAKYGCLFDTFPDLVDRVKVLDSGDLDFMMVTRVEGDEEIDPKNPDTYQEFDYLEEGWAFDGLVIDRYGCATLKFYQKHGIDELEITLLSFGKWRDE